MPRSFKKLGLIGLCVIAFAFLLFAASLGEKQIEVEKQSTTDAVVVTKVTVGNSEVECGLPVSHGNVQPVTPIQGGDDWLQNTTIYLYNQTNKTIAFGQVRLDFPETGNGTLQAPLRVYNITLGRMPESVAFSGRTGKALPQDPSVRAISFGPHQTVLVDVGAYIDQIRANIDNMAFADVTKCIIRRGIFYFDDGMKWGGGAYWLPDPDRPGRFNSLGRRYFPGDKIPSWPGDRK